jgi:hypothetical protein
MKRSNLFTFFFSALLLFPVVVDALEVPLEKLGLWERRVQSSDDDGPLTALPTVQQCMDAEVLEITKKALEDMKKSCSKNELRKEGNKWIQNRVCKFGKTTMISQGTVEFNGENVSHNDTKDTYDPPMGGHSRRRMVIDSKWLGPCK